MEEFDTEDFTLEEDEDFVLSDGEYRDDANELVKEDEEQTQKTKGKNERLKALQPGGENKVTSHKKRRRMPMRGLEEAAMSRKMKLQGRKKALGRRL